MFRTPAVLPCALVFAIVSAAAAQVVELRLPSPFVAAGPAAVPVHLSASVAGLRPDETVWAAMQGAEAVRLEGVQLGPARTATLLLHRIDPFGAGARIVSATRAADGTIVEREIPRPAAQYWGGTLEGDAQAAVMLSRSDAGTYGFVRDESGTTIFSSGPAGSTGPIAAYLLGDLPPGTIDWVPWTCDALPNPDGDGGIDQQHGSLIEPCRQVKIAVETDDEFYGLFSGAANANTAASAYVGTIYAGMREIYQRDVNAVPQASFVRLWTAGNDPWTAGNTGGQLTELRSYWLANMTGIQRNITQMLSGRGLGGGIAWLNALCTPFGYSVCGNLSGYFPYPLTNGSAQNWDIIVTSHEMGHNFGAPHTHDYCPPADSCAPSGYFGSCQSSQVCSSAGTIMSYCHLCSGGTANILLNFHPLNIGSMSSFMGGMSCNLAGPAVPPVVVNDSATVYQDAATVIDVLANDKPFNCEALTISQVQSPTLSGGTATILPGAGSGGSDAISIVPAPGYSGYDQLSYRARDASNQLSGFAQVNVTVAPLRHPENPIGDSAGLDVRYYALTSPAVLPSFGSLTPYLTGTAMQVNYASTGGNFAASGRADNVGARWTGWVKVDEPGQYSFSINSDDGSRMLIGDTVVVSNDGLHGMVEVTGTIALGAGKHAITIDFFEAGGGAGCIASLAGPGIAKAPIPAARLTRGGTTNHHDLNADGRVDGADLGLLLASWGPGNGVADINGDGTVDGADLGLLLAAWAP